MGWRTAIEREARLLPYLLFFLNDPAATEIYTLSLHDALPISLPEAMSMLPPALIAELARKLYDARKTRTQLRRSEEHTSELQSPDHLVCRLLLEKKKKL